MDVHAQVFRNRRISGVYYFLSETSDFTGSLLETCATTLVVRRKIRDHDDN